MKSTLSYGATTYGNNANAASYVVKLARPKPAGPIIISFAFDKPAEGRGIGTRGEVRSVTLDLPRNTARALSHALQLALDDTASTVVQFKIDENMPSD